MSVCRLVLEPSSLGIDPSNVFELQFVCIQNNNSESEMLLT